MHLTGPLARYAINGRWLSPIALQAAAETGLGDPREGKVERNQFRSIIVRAVELLYAIDEALRLVEAYEPLIANSISEHAPLIERAGAGDLIEKKGWYLVYRKATEGNPAFEAFRKWVKTEAKAT